MRVIASFSLVCPTVDDSRRDSGASRLARDLHSKKCKVPIKRVERVKVRINTTTRVQSVVCLYFVSHEINRLSSVIKRLSCLILMMRSVTQQIYHFKEECQRLQENRFENPSFEINCYTSIMH